MEKIKLDLVPSGKMPSLHASQYDDGREHGIDLFENGVVYKLDGTETLTINERKGDDCICSLDIENTFTGSNHIVFASTEQMCAVWGNNLCELVIAKGETAIGTLNFILEIEPSPTEGGMESESEIKNLKRQIEDITEEVIGDDYYTAEQTDEAIATATEGKADKTYVDTELDKKADKSNTYTKTEVNTLIDNLPAPMIFKGTLGEGGTIQTLPTASASNEGFTYKVITDGTYAGQTAKAGDVFTSNGSEWVLIPAGDEDTDTWRAIKVNGVEKLGNGISSGSLDIVDTDNIEAEFDNDGNKLKLKTKNIYTKTEVDSIVSDAIYNVLPDDTASGSIATFETDLALPLKSLKADVNAKQDLHGYSYPWIAGGGKNKLENTASSQTISGVTFTVNSDGTVSVNGTATEDIDFTIKSQVVFPSGNYILNGCPANGSTSTYRLFATNFGSDVGNGLNFSGDGVKSSTIRINIKANVTISNLLFKPMVRLATITDATYEPYENICPIEGWSDVQIANCGNTELAPFLRGLLQGKYGFVEMNSLNWMSSTYVDVNYFVTTLSLPNVKAPKSSGQTANAICNGYQNVPSNGVTSPVFVSGTMFIWTTGRLFLKDANYTDVPSFVSSLQGKYLIYELATPVTPTITEEQINTICEAFNANNTFVKINLGGTYYGGKLDVKTGLFIADVRYIVFDGTQAVGLANWRPLDNSVGWLYKPEITPNIKNYVVDESNLPYCKLKSNRLKTVVYGEAQGLYGNDIPCISLVGTIYWGIGMRVNDTSLNNATAINNWLSQNPIEVVYELETPIEIQLTPTQISTFIGTNNIFADTGDTSVVFKDSVNGYVEKKIASVQALALNT